MSGRFISGGQIDGQTGGLPSAAKPPSPPPPPPSQQSTHPPTRKDHEWAAVQSQIDARKRQDAESAQQGNSERSLYEILQANKAAKQAAFEEAHRLKNQFRPLDEDEAEYLDELRSRRRAEEERERRETEEGLRAFRAAQRRDASSATAVGGGAGGAGAGGAGAGGAEGDAVGNEIGDREDDWAVGGSRKRKRKTGRDDGVHGLLIKSKRRVSLGGDSTKGANEQKSREAKVKEAKGVQVNNALNTTKSEAPTRTPQLEREKPVPGTNAKPKTGLVDYGSDDNSD